MSLALATRRARLLAVRDAIDANGGGALHLHAGTMEPNPETAASSPPLVIVALVAALGTFLFLMGALGVEPDATSATILLAFDVVLVIGLVGIIGRHLWRLRKASQAGRAGARLHRRGGMEAG